jgi:hypothetical protein
MHPRRRVGHVLFSRLTESVLNRGRTGCKILEDAGQSRHPGGDTQMAEPIANDWKAIHDRMQQIKLEESVWPCRRCGGRGWMPNPVRPRAQRGYMFSPCDDCDNPNDLPSPDLSEGGFRRNALG